MSAAPVHKPIVHFVGSIPLPDAETVFRTLAAATGPHLKRLPDGETAIAGRTGFAQDSSLEGTGFEPSVPRDTTNPSSRLWLVPANRKVGAKENRHTKRRALPPRNRWFESCSLRRRVRCEPDFGANLIDGRPPHD